MGTHSTRRSFIKAALAGAGLTVETIQVGDEAMMLEGWARIEAITHIAEQTQTHNLSRVAPGNTFFAGGVLVHNKGGDMQSDQE